MMTKFDLEVLVNQILTVAINLIQRNQGLSVACELLKSDLYSIRETLQEEITRRTPQ